MQDFADRLLEAMGFPEDLEILEFTIDCSSGYGFGHMSFKIPEQEYRCIQFNDDCER